MHDLTCADVIDAAPQFALDILEPSQRADVAAHLIRCPGCRTTVTGMQESAAALLDLDGADWTRPLPAEVPCPDASPEPAGAVGSGRRRIRLVITLTAAALFMVGSTFGPEIQAAVHHPPTPIARAELLDGTRPVGFVHFYSGRSPALDVEVTGITGQGRAVAETVGLDGTVTQLGSFGLYQGHGYWSSTTPVDPSRVSNLMVVDGQGRVLATASLGVSIS